MEQIQKKPGASSLFQPSGEEKQSSSGFPEYAALMPGAKAKGMAANALDQSVVITEIEVLKLCVMIAASKIPEFDIVQDACGGNCTYVLKRG